jgi:hypothetical protein
VDFPPASTVRQAIANFPPKYQLHTHARRRKAFWLYTQRYFRDDKQRHPKKGARTVRVRIPRRQAINRRAIARMRECKNESL